MTSTVNTPSDTPLESALFSAEVERAVLGAIFNAAAYHPDAGYVEDIARIVGTEMAFFDPTHRRIYRRIMECLRNQELPHPSTVLRYFDGNDHRLTQNGEYLRVLLTGGIAVRGIKDAKALREFHLLRDELEFAQITAAEVKAASAADARVLADRIRARAEKLGIDLADNRLISEEENAGALWGDMEAMMEEGVQPADTRVFPTPWPDLDAMMRGISPGQVCVVAARPGVGKSTLARNWVWHAAVNHNIPSVFFSLEMSAREIGQCMMASGSKVRLDKIQDPLLLEEPDIIRIAKYLGKIQNKPLYYDQTPGTSLADMDRALRQIKRKHGNVGLAAFDYLQLSPEPAGWRGDSRQGFVSELSRGMKLLAKEHEIGLILVSQLNRGVESRSDKLPMLSDLRESGSIEQDADKVILIHRPDYYDKEDPRAGEADFILAKHRNGPTGTVAVASRLHLSQFAPMD